jgi:hypothetical protein
MASAEQRAQLRETVYRWRQEDRPIFLGDFWNDGPLVGGCMADGRYYFHIYANGDISPCVFSPIACGNIFDIGHGRSGYVSLRDFAERHPTFVAFRRERLPCGPEHDRRLRRRRDCQAHRRRRKGLGGNGRTPAPSAGETRTASRGYCGGDDLDPRSRHSHPDLWRLFRIQPRLPYPSEGRMFLREGYE